VILRCLEKDRERRYPNIAMFAHALVDFGPKRARGSVERITRTIQAAGLSASALELPPSSEGTSDAAQAATAGTGTEAPWGRTTTRQRKSSRAIAIGGGVALVAALGALAAVLRHGQHSNVDPEATSAAANGAVPSAIVASAASIVVSAVEPAVATTPPTAVGLQPPVGTLVVARPPTSKNSPPKHQGHSAAPSDPSKPLTSAAATPVAATATSRPPPKTTIFDDR
jgi:hypothetical protein